MEQNITQPNINASGGAGGSGSTGGGGGSGGTVIFAQVKTEDDTEVSSQLKQIEKRLSLLEFLLPASLSIIATFIYALIKILKVAFNTSPMFYQGIWFFVITFLAFNFFLFIVNALEKVGSNLIALKLLWQKESLITKIFAILGLPSSLIGIVQIIKWTNEFITNYTK